MGVVLRSPNLNELAPTFTFLLKDLNNFPTPRLGHLAVAVAGPGGSRRPGDL
jgi:hypothetical protein